MESLSEAEKLLSDAGWFSGRKIDIARIIEFLEARGVSVFESAMKFLEEFGELEIETPRDIDEELLSQLGYSKNEKTSTCVKEAYGDALTSVFAESLEEYVNEKLIVVGSLREQTLLLISESGDLFCSEGGKIGSSMFDVAEYLLNPDHCTIPFWMLD